MSSTARSADLPDEQPVGVGNGHRTRLLRDAAVEHQLEGIPRCQSHRDEVVTTDAETRGVPLDVFEERRVGREDRRPQTPDAGQLGVFEGVQVGVDLGGAHLPTVTLRGFARRKVARAPGFRGARATLASGKRG